MTIEWGVLEDLVADLQADGYQLDAIVPETSAATEKKAYLFRVSKAAGEDQ